MQQRYLSRLRPVQIRRLMGAVCFIGPLSALFIWLWHSMLDEQLIFSSAAHPPGPPTALWQSVFITVGLFSPSMALLMWVPPALITGWWSVTLTDDAVRLRRVAGVRTIPRDDVTFIGLRVQGAWLLSGLGLTVPPSAYYQPNGCPIPAMRLVIEYKNRRRYWPGRLRWVGLPPLFTRQEMDAMHAWAAAGTMAAA